MTRQLACPPCQCGRTRVSRHMMMQANLREPGGVRIALAGSESTETPWGTRGDIRFKRPVGATGPDERAAVSRGRSRRIECLRVGARWRDPCPLDVHLPWPHLEHLSGLLRHWQRYLLMNYQGRLTNETGLHGAARSPHVRRVRCCYWRNQLPAGAPWEETQSVQVTDGILSVLIGGVKAFPMGTVHPAGRRTPTGHCASFRSSLMARSSLPRQRIVSSPTPFGRIRLDSPRQPTGRGAKGRHWCRRTQGPTGAQRETLVPRDRRGQRETLCHGNRRGHRAKGRHWRRGTCGTHVCCLCQRR